MLLRIFAAFLLAVGLLSSAQAAERRAVVLAASSLQESMTEVATAWEAKGNKAPVLSFAASSALARQIEAGAPADIFISADEPWMDYLEQRNRIRKGSRMAFLKNHLVLIAPARSKIKLTIGPGFPIAQALGNGRLSLADISGVPAGVYAQQALRYYGVWPSVFNRIARGENVRAALALVERNAAPLGIVYATDARASKAVRVVATFPDKSHEPIIYPIAIVAGSMNTDASSFLSFVTSAQGRAIFAKHGFDFP